MGSFKPFLFGAAFGAGIAFVALQYHVVQSQEGFRVVPRMPQHSLGLAYADVRHWDADQWADRPELVRALIANGSTDLVTGSVIDGAIESVSSDSGTLDQLKDFLNESATETNDGDSLFDSSSFLSIPEPDSEPDEDSFESRFQVPFPDEARRKTLETARRDSSARTSATHQERPSIGEVFSAGTGKLSDLSDSRLQSESSLAGSKASQDFDSEPKLTADEEAALLEEMLFGDDRSSVSSGQDEDDGSFGIFEDVTSSLENRAEDVLKKAKSGIRNETSRAVGDSMDSVNRFVRDRVESVQDSVSGMFSEDTGGNSLKSTDDEDLPKAIRALRNGFDPFVE